jgi:type II secretory pathway predicted ATPase ExeA
MYFEHFGLHTDPFSLSPRLDFLYQSEAFEESIAHLVHGLDYKEALTLITGPIGSGKTMVIQSFLFNLGPKYATSLVTSTQVSSLELLKLILEDLAVDIPTGADKSDVLILFKNFLLAEKQRGRTVLVIIDEAQNLSTETLEELRLLTNLGQIDGQAVQIILMGQPELDRKIDLPELAQLKQRVRVHYRLAPLNRREIAEYIDHRMRVAGCDRPVFRKDAVARIAELSGGVPRLVNTAAGEALLAAFVAGAEEVRAAHVEEPGPRRIEPTVGGPVNAAPESVPQREPEPTPAPVPSASPAVPPPTTLESDPASPWPAAPVTSQAQQRQASGAEAASVPGRAVAARRDSARTANSARRRRAWLWAAVIIPILLVSAWYLRNLLLTGSPRFFVRDRAAVTSDQIVASGGDENPSPPAATTEPIGADPGESAENRAQATDLSTDSVEPEIIVEAGTEEDSAAIDSAVAVVHDSYVVHVCSFRSPQRVESFRRLLGDASTPVFDRRVVIDGEPWYRVFIGPYPDAETAQQAVDRFLQGGLIRYYRILKYGDVTLS